MRVGNRATRKGGSPLGGERGFVEDVRTGQRLLLNKSWQRRLHVQRHQAVNKGFPIIAGGQSGRWGVVAEIGAGEGGSVWVRKGLEELGAVRVEEGGFVSNHAGPSFFLPLLHFPHRP